MNRNRKFKQLYGRLDMVDLDRHEKYYGSLGLADPFTVETKQGNPILLDGTKERPFEGMRIFGKSTQDGTPSPKNPVPIVSAGDSGEIGVSVGGGQLLDLREGKSGTGEGVTYTRNEDETYLATGTATGTNGNVWFLGGHGKDPELPENVVFTLQPGVYTARDCILYSKVTTYGNYGTFTLTKTLNITGIKNPPQEVGKSYNDVIYPMLNAGSTALAFEPYVTPQTLTLSTPGGLPGIPVSSGGNYTDESGQQRICNEIDLARGKYVQRIGHNANVNDWVRMPGNPDIESTTSRFALDIENIDNYKYSPCICNRLSYAKVDSYGTEGTYVTINETSSKCIFARIEGITSLEDFRAAMPDLEVIWLLGTPIETDLPAEEIAAYKALHTYSPTTTVSNDADTEMEIKYKKYPIGGMS